MEVSGHALNKNRELDEELKKLQDLEDDIAGEVRNILEELKIHWMMRYESIFHQNSREIWL